VDQKIFFGQTANVTAEITSIAANIADEQVTETLRAKLKKVFKPRLGTLYAELAILPALDEIRLDDERPTLIILEHPAGQLPPDFVAWWNRSGVRILWRDSDCMVGFKPSAFSTNR